MTIPCCVLNTGAKMPLLGLGTWLSKKGEMRNAVRIALQAGYTHIDCAQIYGNESEVGEGIKDWGGDRTKIWVTSKLWNNQHRPSEVPKGLEKTLKDLQLDYLDLYLMHWPLAFKPGGESVPKDQDGNVLLDKEVTVEETWAAMENLLDTGKVKAIGISNFSQKDLESLLKSAKTKPAVHQFETHPYLQQQAFVDWHKEQGIAITAYSPFGNQNQVYDSGAKVETLIKDPTIKKIAKKHHTTAAAVTLAWGIKRGTSVVPKSVNEGRIKQNMACLKVVLDEEDMKEIADINGPHRFNNPKNWGKKFFEDLEGA